MTVLEHAAVGRSCVIVIGIASLFARYFIRKSGTIKSSEDRLASEIPGAKKSDGKSWYEMPNQSI